MADKIVIEDFEYLVINWKYIFLLNLSLITSLLNDKKHKYKYVKATTSISLSQ